MNGRTVARLLVSRVAGDVVRELRAMGAGSYDDSVQDMAIEDAHECGLGPEGDSSAEFVEAWCEAMGERIEARYSVDGGAECCFEDMGDGDLADVRALKVGEVWVDGGAVAAVSVRRVR